MRGILRNRPHAIHIPERRLRFLSVPVVESNTTLPENLRLYPVNSVVHSISSTLTPNVGLPKGEEDAIVEAFTFHVHEDHIPVTGGSVLIGVPEFTRRESTTPTHLPFNQERSSPVRPPASECRIVSP